MCIGHEIYDQFTCNHHHRFHNLLFFRNNIHPVFFFGFIGVDPDQTVFGRFVVGENINFVPDVVNRVKFRFVAIQQIDKLAVAFAEVFKIERISMRADALRDKQEPFVIS